VLLQVLVQVLTMELLSTLRMLLNNNIHKPDIEIDYMTMHFLVHSLAPELELELA
jgi:hypothetical protein